MPEDISEEPKNAKLVEIIKQPAFTSKVSKYVFDKINKGGEAKATVQHESILAVIPNVTKRLGDLYPDLSKDTISELCDFYFGIYNMDEGSMTQEGRKKFETSKIRSAKIQQSRAHAIFYASLGEGGPEYAQKVLDSVATHEAIARSAAGRESGALLLNTGINTFIATTRYFYESGYDVFIPNYSGDAQEVKEWDVDRGIDGCAIKIKDNGDPLFLLYDAKGQMNYSQNDRHLRDGERREADVFAEKMIWQEVARLPKSLRDLIGFYDPDKKYTDVFKARITVPTHTNFITYFESAYKMAKDKGPAAVLNEYARFSSEVYLSLNSKLDYSLKRASQKK